MTSIPDKSRRLIHWHGMSNRLFWAVLGGLLTLATILVLVAPLEKTLGEGIRSVYVHVALTWSGMLGITVSGLLGLVTAITGKQVFIDWFRSIGWVALVMFAAGLIMSVLAARINWGSVFWQEPRTSTALEILAFCLAIQVASYWPIPKRLKGFLYVVATSFMIWNVGSTPRVLHPGNAARATSSAAIRWTFIGLFVLVSVAASWIVLHRQMSNHPPVVQLKQHDQSDSK